ncbi:NAD(P)-dependent oxidoreductase [Microbacterium resistens]|uniref:NAD(P)-dependent oxidoreductase n=1 Tax=Microbacterium resistens TaxID=156977 RepID=UPI001E427A3C|nr:NAD(P)-dependent oxidoreductase [Microbacterium resistens]
MLTRELGHAVSVVMRDGATLINTARGSLVDERALLHELRRERLRAVLDVTDQEPLHPGAPRLTAPGAFITPHIAGSQGSEVRRLGAAAIAEVHRYHRGEPFRHPVASARLGTSA